MRHPLTSAIASFAFATTLVGTASAVDVTAPVKSPQISDNRAAEDQLERDSQQPWLQRSPAGVVISPIDRTPSRTSGADYEVFSPGVRSDGGAVGKPSGGQHAEEVAGLTSRKQK